ncbi:hypothetical protein PBC5_073 [Bacillus phage PBC5]|nr:hypothetical protein PBC5_073 [Bacillus phage PBC5]
MVFKYTFRIIFYPCGGNTPKWCDSFMALSAPIKNSDLREAYEKLYRKHNSTELAILSWRSGK